MDRTRKIRLISNSFYNAGLERAKRRDLTGRVSEKMPEPEQVSY